MVRLALWGLAVFSLIASPLRGETPVEKRFRSAVRVASANVRRLGLGRILLVTRTVAPADRKQALTSLTRHVKHRLYHDLKAAGVAIEASGDADRVMADRDLPPDGRLAAQLIGLTNASAVLCADVIERGARRRLHLRLLTGDGVEWQRVVRLPDKPSNRAGNAGRRSSSPGGLKAPGCVPGGF